jgi:hypothetical protein
VDNRHGCIFFEGLRLARRSLKFLGDRRSKTENAMPLDIPARGNAPVTYPLQFINIEITPLIDGEYSVAMQATLLDEERPNKSGSRRR